MLLKYTLNTKNCKNKENITVNYILKNEFQISSRLFTKLINNKCVMVNNIPCDTRNFVHIDDTVTVNLDYKENNENIVAKNIPLDIIYEDDSFLVINKPAGIAIHPSFRYFDNTLSNGVKYYFDQIGLHKKIRPVNRLDFNTSGLVVFAKNEYIQECFIKQMANNKFEKTYLAVVTGKLQSKSGVIDKPISRKSDSIIERCVSENGKPSITEFQVLKEYNDFSLVKCFLKTGRTHQIRVHFASIGHPLLGDDLYGSKSELINGQALSCYSLSLVHPITKCKLTFTLQDFPFAFLLK